MSLVLSANTNHCQWLLEELKLPPRCAWCVGKKMFQLDCIMEQSLAMLADHFLEDVLIEKEPQDVSFNLIVQ